MPPRPRVEWTRHRVQNLLLSLGVLLLTVAALIFIAVNWGTLGAGGRDAVMAAVTVSAAVAATVAARRALPATAESVATLAVALLVVDSFGLRRAGLASGIAPTTYAGAASAAIAILVVVWLAYVRLRALGIAALVAAELALPLATLTGTAHPAGVAAVYGLQIAALLALRFHFMTRVGADAGPIALRLLRVTTYLWWALALLIAAIATYGPAAERSAWGPFELMVFAALAGWAARHEIAELHLALAVATAIAAACGIAPYLDASWRASAVEAAALLVAVVVLLVPARIARASIVVVAATGLGALLTAIKPIAEAFAAPGAVAGHEVWNSTWAQVRSLHAPDAISTGRPWAGTAHLAVLGLAALATAVVLGAKADAGSKTHTAARRIAFPAVAALVVVNLILVPLEAGWTLPAAVGWELALGGTLLVVAVMKDPVDIRPPAIVGGGFLVHASLWSLRSPALTAMAVGVTLAAGVIAAHVTRYQLVLTTSAAVLVAVETDLIAAYQGATFAAAGVVLAAVTVAMMTATYVLREHLDKALSTALQSVALVTAVTAIGFSAYEPSTLTTTTALVIVAIAPAVVIGRAPLAPAWPAFVQVLICLEVDAVHRWATPGADVGSRALVLAVAAAAVSVVAHGFQRTLKALALITGPSVYALATLGTVTAGRFDPVWQALLVGGVAAALITALGAVANLAVTDGVDSRLTIQLPAAISSLLLVASSWVRLAESHVHFVEPYTVPAAMILIAAGFLRRRADREAGSWPCYGPGLVLGLVPTLIQALADPGLVRPVLVGVASLLVLIAGIRGRLQAPLAVGGSVLAIDVVAQLSPALAAGYGAVPRWTLIALAGALLLVLGATYESRIRDLRALGRKFGRLR